MLTAILALSVTNMIALVLILCYLKEARVHRKCKFRYDSKCYEILGESLDRIEMRRVKK